MELTLKFLWHAPWMAASFFLPTKEIDGWKPVCKRAGESPMGLSNDGWRVTVVFPTPPLKVTISHK